MTFEEQKRFFELLRPAVPDDLKEFCDDWFEKTYGDDKTKVS